MATGMPKPCALNPQRRCYSVYRSFLLLFVSSSSFPTQKVFSLGAWPPAVSRLLSSWIYHGRGRTIFPRSCVGNSNSPPGLWVASLGARAGPPRSHGGQGWHSGVAGPRVHSLGAPAGRGPPPVRPQVVGGGGVQLNGSQKGDVCWSQSGHSPLHGGPRLCKTGESTLRVGSFQAFSPRQPLKQPSVTL